jgi:hypothetical protein
MLVATIFPSPHRVWLWYLPDLLSYGLCGRLWDCQLWDLHEVELSFAPPPLSSLPRPFPACW